jgi:prepilin-type N-terminal cleavage/methylation domain-containing protein
MIPLCSEKGVEEHGLPSSPVVNNLSYSLQPTAYSLPGRRVPPLARKQCRERCVDEHGLPPSPAPHRLPFTLHSSLFTLHSSPFTLHSSRPGFTLTELLIVITIIGMLASMTLGALYSARESARVAKTQATITKLDAIIQAKYAEFLTRRLPIASRLSNNRPIHPKVMAELKLQVLREIIRMEMPDRLTDITYPRIDPTNTNRSRDDIDATFNVTVGTVTETLRRPAINRRYFRKIYDMSKTDGTLLISTKFAEAELLYLVVASDPDAREQFTENEIGDNDGDGFFEFVDGWGRPIMFLRWAPAFRSDIQTGDVENDHDPFDTRKIDPMAFRLAPLIYSGGPDKKFGLKNEGSTAGDVWVFQFGFLDTDVSRLFNHADGATIGMPVDDPADDEYNCHLDNITNHSLGMN